MKKYKIQVKEFDVLGCSEPEQVVKSSAARLVFALSPPAVPGSNSGNKAKTTEQVKIFPPRQVYNEYGEFVVIDSILHPPDSTDMTTLQVL
jgi:hypothetical protein